jgi:carbon starvation protein
MSLLVVVTCCAAVLLLAYKVYGGVLARLLRLDGHRQTPAVELRDDVDYVPIDKKFLLGQHFSAIAAAGPIAGPIAAAVLFGWLPALIWILVGAIFIGGVHDMTALTASIRHRARSIAEVVREYMTRRSYVLFLCFVWLALVYIIVAFADLTASSFVGESVLENGETVKGPGIATSSLLYLALPLAMGLLLKYARLPLWLATVIFLPLVGVAIWVGQYIPLDLAAWLGISDARARAVWNVLLLVYCFVASVIPMWLLLQPRGHLGGYFLYAALVSAALGLMFGGKSVQFPAFIAWESAKGPLLPILFITIACGACSGFHSMVASGTTSKQLRYETDAKPIGYGAMLLEGMVAIISLCCVMMLAANSPLLSGEIKPNLIYANGIAGFLSVVGVPVAFGISFGLMAFTTFVYDTLDVCTRLGRYVVEELTGWHGPFGRCFATAITAGVPVYFLVTQHVDATGKVIPAWSVFWNLFGASNQLLAALTLVGVTVWLWRTRRARWVWLVTGLPAVWMYVVSVWALVRLTQLNFAKGVTANPIPWVSMLLIALAALMAVEAARVILAAGVRPPPRPTPIAVPA